MARAPPLCSPAAGFFPQELGSPTLSCASNSECSDRQEQRLAAAEAALEELQGALGEAERGRRAAEEDAAAVRKRAWVVVSLSLSLVVGAMLSTRR